MSRASLWKLSVTTTREAEDCVMELLTRCFQTAASSFVSLRTGVNWVSVFLPRRPSPQSTAMREVREGLRDLRRNGVNVGSGRLSQKSLPRENWAESWKRHFPPKEIGNALLVKPSWSKRKPRRGQAEIVLDPGLSFGTGKHPTTEFCLREIVARRQPGTRQSFLDIGTGSGILALAAAKLGYAPVEAFDFDPVAVKSARRNAKANGLARNMRIYQADITRLATRSPRHYSLVCANLQANLLLTEQRRLLARLAPRGVLVLAGILRSEFATVQASYELAGWRLVASAGDREWRSGSLRRD